VAARSAIGKGFEALGREPALLLAEIAWRWSFAAAAWLVTLVAALEYVNSIPVTWREELLVRSRQPLLALAAVVHALQGSGARLAGGVAVAATALAVLWIWCAALGRLATLNALVPGAGGGAYRSLLGLSFLRAGLLLAALLAAAGALILAGFTAPDGVRSPVVAMVLIACIWLVWALLNWLMSVAAIFVVGKGEDTFAGIAAAADFVRENFGEVVLTSLPFVLLHYAALAAAAAAVVLIFHLMAQVSAGAGWAILAIAAGYFLYADFLYITRLAAYVWLTGPGGEAESHDSPGLKPELSLAPESPD
jgi:hypothetical protein